MTERFIPRSIQFIKARAEELRAAFPFISVSTALETTAIALGYTDWQDANHRLKGISLKTTNHDEDIDYSDRLKRRHQHGVALLEIANLPAIEVDCFIRCWNLTAKERNSDAKKYKSNYDEARAYLEEFNKYIQDGGGLEEWPDYDRHGEVPKRLAPDLVLNTSRKHSYLVPTLEATAAIPLPLRGNFSTFLTHEVGKSLVLSRPDWCSSIGSIKEGIDYLYGTNLATLMILNLDSHISEEDICEAGQIKKQLSDHLEGYYPLSIRWRPELLTARREDTPTSTEEYLVPFISGAGLQDFFTNYNRFSYREIVWKRTTINPFFEKGFPLMSENISSFSKKEICDLEDVDIPPYISPWKHEPFSSIEYLFNTEGYVVPVQMELEEPQDQSNKLGG